MFSLTEASAVAREPELVAALDAVDRYLAGASGPARFRAARNSPVATPDRDAYAGLAQVGVPSAMVPEDMGGSGLAPGAAALIAERLGRALAREPFIENVVLPVGLGLALRSRALMDAITKGEILCVAWQEGPFERPGASPIATRLERGGGGLRLSGHKRFVMGARAASRMLVLADMEGETAIAGVPAATAGVARQDKTLADGTCWSDVEFDVSLEEQDVIARGEEAVSALSSAIDLANIAIAGMLYGLQSRILELTLEYLGTRVQFDRPIGSFQALQHRAVDLYAHAQIARFLIGETVDSAARGVPPRVLEVYASRAKARAADSGLRIAKEGIQMHGGIGFSDEYDLGLYVKRILVLSAWLGNADWHRRHLAAIDPLGEGAIA